MEIVNINALWSQNYFNHKTLMQKLKNQYNEIKYIDYDYDFKREQIKFFNIAPMLPVLIIFNDNQEVARLYNPTLEQIEKILDNKYAN